MSPVAVGVLLVFFSVAAWSSNYIVGRYLASSGVDPVALTVARFLLATPFLLAVVGPPRYRGGALELLLLGLLGIALFNLTLYTSLAYISAAVASLFIVLASPTTQLIESLVNKRPPKLSALIGAVLSVVGAYLILEPYIAVRSYVGPVLAAAATVIWSLYTVRVKKIYRLYPPREATVWIYTLGTTLLLPASTAADFTSLASPTAAALVLYIAVVPGALAYTSWNIAVEKLGPRRSAAMLPLMPVLTTVFSIFILGEGLLPTQLLGMAISIAGVVMAVR